MSHISIVGIDIAKNVFHLHGVYKHGQCFLQKKVSRKQFTRVVAQLKCDEIVMEACAGSNHWFRVLSQLGHQVKLISPQFVRPYVKTNKNDYQDAQGICEAAARANMVFVQPKDLARQDIQTLHRLRQGYVEERTAVINRLRGLLAEYGVVMPIGIGHARKSMPKILSGELGQGGLSVLSLELLGDLWDFFKQIDQKVKDCDRRVEAVCQQYKSCRLLASIPGVGALIATALYAQLGDASHFENGRHVSAYLGLVPRQYSSGGKDRLLGISKRSNTYLRTLLIHGARALICHAKNKVDRYSQWINRLRSQKAYNQVAVALANKMARIALAILYAQKEL